MTTLQARHRLYPEILCWAALWPKVGTGILERGAHRGRDGGASAQGTAGALEAGKSSRRVSSGGPKGEGKGVRGGTKIRIEQAKHGEDQRLRGPAGWCGCDSPGASSGRGFWGETEARAPGSHSRSQNRATAPHREASLLRQQGSQQPQSPKRPSDGRWRASWSPLLRWLGNDEGPSPLPSVASTGVVQGHAAALSPTEGTGLGPLPPTPSGSPLGGEVPSVPVGQRSRSSPCPLQALIGPWTQVSTPGSHSSHAPSAPRLVGMKPQYGQHGGGS